MFNKYLLGLCGALVLVCCIFYNMWDKTKTELNLVKAEKVTLEQEIKRRNENAAKLTKRLEELRKVLDDNADWADIPVPVSVSNGLCKPKCGVK